MKGKRRRQAARCTRCDLPWRRQEHCHPTRPDELICGPCASELEAELRSGHGDAAKKTITDAALAGVESKIRDEEASTALNDEEERLRREIARGAGPVAIQRLLELAREKERANMLKCPPVFKRKAYLLAEIQPDRDPTARPVVGRVAVFSEERPSIAFGGTYVTICQAEAPTYDEARRRVIETARLAWPWLADLIQE